MTDDQQPRRGRIITTQQKQYLLELLQTYPNLLGSKSTNPVIQNLWCDVTVDLNGLPGPTKTTAQWRRTLHDLVYRASRKKKKELREPVKSKHINYGYQHVNYLFVDSSEARGTDKLTDVLVHDGDPNLSDAASWTETESQSDEFSSLLEEYKMDVNIQERDDSVEQEQNMAFAACSVDDFCAHANSVTPPSFLEEIVMYSLNLREIIS